MRLYFILILLAVLLSFVTGYIALFLQGSYTATAEDIEEISQLKLVFQKEVDPQIIVNFNSLYFSKEQMKLTDPVYAVPYQTNQFSPEVYATEQNCLKGLKSIFDRNRYEKFWIWEEFRCGHRETLPRGFFVESPYIHPSGSSYAYLAFLLGKDDFDKKNWVNNHLSLFHILELRKLRKEIGELKGEFRVLATLSEDSLRDISKGKGTILTQDYLFARLKYPSFFSILEYRVYSRDDLERFLAHSPYILSNYRQGKPCFYKDGSLCWSYNVNHIFKLANKSTLLFFGILILFTVVLVRLLLVKIRAQRLEDEKRRLALRVLTHEFRTPITSILLLVEKFSKKFDQLDGDLQEAFLRLSNEAHRLKRLTETSRNYLKAEQHKRLIQLNYEDIELSEFILDVMQPFLDRFPDQLHLNSPEEEIVVRVDTYWFNICLKNLIENSVTHGKLPVDISVKKQQNKVIISIVDQGDCEFSSIDQMTGEFVKGSHSSGTGLGMNIVKNVVKEMGLKLTLSLNPTTFNLILPFKGANHGQATSR